MRQVKASDITNKVRDLCLNANFDLRKDVLDALKKSSSIEESSLGKDVIEALVENAKIAKKKSVSLCQDAGYVTVFFEVGQDVHISGGSLFEAAEEGVKSAYIEGSLRKSIVSDPCFSRTNTQDNTPPLVYEKSVPGEEIKIVVMPKGGGSENVSRLEMGKLAPDLAGEVTRFVLETVKNAGAKACPPMIIGVGIGGSFDSVGHFAKKTLLRKVGSKNSDSQLAELEVTILKEVNDLGIGPAGLGGRVTALAVHIESFPTHMACFPLAVNISCHALRSAEAIL